MYRRCTGPWPLCASRRPRPGNCNVELDFKVYNQLRRVIHSQGEMVQTRLEVIILHCDYTQPQVDLISSLAARIHVEDRLEGNSGKLV